MSKEDLLFHTEYSLYGVQGTRDAQAIIDRCIGKKIIEAEFFDDQIRIKFADMKILKIWDGGQSCCENRFMRTDDDLQDIVGNDFKGLKLSTVGISEFEGDYDVREIQFLEIKSSSCNSVVFSSHNEHNGYYGGFSICVKEV